jgi:hypothetical protein
MFGLLSVKIEFLEGHGQSLGVASSRQLDSEGKSKNCLN